MHKIGVPRRVLTGSDEPSVVGRGNMKGPGGEGKRLEKNTIGSCGNYDDRDKRRYKDK